MQTAALIEGLGVIRAHATLEEKMHLLERSLNRISAFMGTSSLRPVHPDTVEGQWRNASLSWLVFWT